MSFENEDEEGEKKDPLDFDFDLPDLGLDTPGTTTPPTAPPTPVLTPRIAVPPTITPPTIAPPTHSPTPAAPAPVIPSGPSQAEYDALSGQIQQKDSNISQLQNQINEIRLEIGKLKNK